MGIVVSTAVLGLLTLPAQAQILPEWAYSVPPPLAPLDDTVQKHLAGSTKAYTQAQIDDGFNPPDWYPQDHPPMPDVVAHGRKAANARACAMCHLTSGAGQPESAFIAGLPIAYIVRQVAEFAQGTDLVQGGRNSHCAEVPSCKRCHAAPSGARRHRAARQPDHRITAG